MQLFPRSYFWSFLGIFFLSILVSPFCSEKVDAQKRSFKFSKKSLPKKNTRLTAVIINSDTGQILYEENAHALRCPASTIKILTVYLVFSALKKGILKLTDQLPVSQYAAKQPPSKVGLKAGMTISVRDAILGTLVKSGNDTAVVLGEAISGTEKKFTHLMTQTARKLGVKKTFCINASGFPDTAQGALDHRYVSTAYEIAKLSQAVIRDFPEYYKFFSVQKFTFRGITHKNSNTLLKKMDGVDGLKTGYGGSAVGFNLAASGKRGNTRIIAVLMGARTPLERTQKMTSLLEKGFSLVGPLKATQPSLNPPPLPPFQEREFSPSDKIDLEYLKEIFGEPTGLLPESPKEVPHTSPPSQNLKKASVASAPAVVLEAAPEILSSASLEDSPSLPPEFEEDFSQFLEESPSSSSQNPPSPKMAPLPPPREKPRSPSIKRTVPKTIPFGKTRDLPPMPEKPSFAEDIGPPPKKPRNPFLKNKESAQKWAIQVGTLSTSLQAKTEGKRLSEAFPKLLKPHALKILKVEKKNRKKAFPVRFLGFSKKAAEKACKTLSSQRKACTVIRLP